MAAYPPEHIPHDKKDAAWIARYMAAFLAEARDHPLFSTRSTWGADSQDALSLTTLTSYAEGRQGKERTRRFAREAAGADSAALAEYHLAPGVLSVAPAFESQFCSLMASQSVVVSVSAYDVQPDGSLSAPAQAMQKGAAVLRQKPLLDAVGLDARAVLSEQIPELTGESLPVDEAHLRYQVRERVKEADPVALQADVNQAFDKMNLVQTLEEVGRNFFRQNAGALHVPLARPHVPRYLSPQQVVALSSAYPDFRDARAMGHYEMLTIGELKAQIRACDARAAAPAREKAKAAKEKQPTPASSLPTETEWREMAQAAGWKEGGPETITRGSDGESVTVPPYDSHRVRVLRVYFKSASKETQREGVSKSGNRFARRGEKAGKEGEEVSASVEWLYTGLLVPDRKRPDGTPMAFACEKAYDQLRDPWVPGETLLPYAAVRVSGPSLLEQMVPVLDKIQFAYERMNEDLHRTLPANTNVDTAGLTTAALAMGAEKGKITELDLIAIYLKHGLGAYNSDPDPQDENQNRRPNPYAYNGAQVPPTVAGYMQVMAWAGAELSRITGLNAVALGLSPETRERMGKGTSEIAVAAANKALGPWLRASAWLFKGAAHRLLLALAGSKNLLRAYNLRVDVGDNEQAWLELYEDGREAMKAGLIDYDDLFAIRRFADLAEAQEYLANKVKVSRQKAEEKAAADIAANGQVQEQSLRAKGEEDRATLTAQHELTMARLEYERETQQLLTGGRESAATERTIIQTTGQVDQLTEKLAHDGTQKLAEQVMQIIREQAQRDYEAQQAAAQAAQQTAPTMEPQPTVA